MVKVLYICVMYIMLLYIYIYIYIYYVYVIYLQHVSVTFVCVMGELFANVYFQICVFVRQFFQNIEQFAHIYI